MIRFSVDASEQPAEIAFEPKALIIAGWTGRDRAAVQAHIDELAELGVAPPKNVPIFYRADSALLTTGPEIQVVGEDSSGEAESVLVRHKGRFYVGLGSDHTDRKLETVGITLSKQVCAKPVAPFLWSWDDVADHWDELVLRAVLPQDGTVYQEGPVSGLLRPDALLALYEERHGAVADGTVMFCGTLPVRGGIRFTPSLRLELEDAKRDRTITHHYSVRPLPVAEA